MSDPQHYLVLGGRVLEEIQWVMNERAKAFDQAKALADEIGNVTRMGLGRRGISGFQFKAGTEVDRKLWKKSMDRSGVWFPKDPDLASRFRLIKTPDFWDLTEHLTGDELHFMDGSIRSLSFELIGESIVLSVPADPKAPDWWKPHPDDARPLKMSEYWKLVEDHAEANAKKPTQTGGGSHA